MSDALYQDLANPSESQVNYFRTLLEQRGQDLANKKWAFLLEGIESPAARNFTALMAENQFNHIRHVMQRSQPLFETTTVSNPGIAQIEKIAFSGSALCQ